MTYVLKSFSDLVLYACMLEIRITDSNQSCKKKDFKFYPWSSFLMKKQNHDSNFAKKVSLTNKPAYKTCF